MVSLRMNGNTFDLSQITKVSSSSSAPKYVLVHFQGSLKPEDDTALQQCFKPLQFVGDDTYLCYYAGKNLAQDVGKLHFITACVPYPPNIKISRGLQQSQQMIVVLHAYPDGGGATARQSVQNICGGAPVIVDSWQLQVSASGSELAQIAALDAVKSIEPTAQFQLAINLARKIINVPDQSAPAGLTADLKNVTTKKRPRLPNAGEGEIITVIDTGLDSGVVGATLPAFGDRVRRILVKPTVAGGNPSVPPVVPNPTHNAAGVLLGPGADFQGHGTHVAGLALGGEAPMAGVAPEAELVAVMFNYEMQPVLPHGFFRIAVDETTSPEYAKIINCSWTSVVRKASEMALDGARAYTSGLAGVVDDAVWLDPELVICISTGNEGDSTYNDEIPCQLGGLAAAKNAIIVGGTQNPRPMEKTKFTYKDPKTALNDRELIMGNPVNMSLNSRGPTAEGRIKPDVVAPGAVISGPRSSAQTARYRLRYDPDPEHPGYCFTSGSSMASPMVAGSVAVLREALRKQGTGPSPVKIMERSSFSSRPAAVSLVKNESPASSSKAFIPSAALLKALIVNGADDLSLQGGKFYTYDHYPVISAEEEKKPTPTPTPAASTNPRVQAQLDAIKVKGAPDGGEMKPKTTPVKQSTLPSHTEYKKTDKQGTLINALVERPIPRAPNSIQGFGMLNVRQSLDMVLNRTYVEGQIAPGGQGVVYAFPPSNTPVELNATLVWTDMSGELLQTYLKLTVVLDDGGPSAVVVNPNQGEEWIDDVSVPKSAENNVQRATCIVPPGISPRAYVDCVRRNGSDKLPLPFALVWSLRPPGKAPKSYSSQTSLSNSDPNNNNNNSNRNNNNNNNSDPNNNNNNSIRNNNSIYDNNTYAQGPYKK